MKKIRYLSLFTGIGSPESGLEVLNIPFELIGFSEIDKFAIKSYCAVHGVDEKLNLGDITKIEIEKLPKDIDLITHGSPCQDFSVAGKGKGADEGTGTRSSLMWNTVAICEHCRPKYVIWENVKNVLSKKHKHNFDKYIDEMERLGYKNYYKVLNAKNYGIPQNRERIFCISIRGDLNKEFEFPKGFNNGLVLKDFLETEVDEKFYISNEKVNRLLFNTKYNPDTSKSCIGTCNTKNDLSFAFRDRVYSMETEGPTLCATDYKDAKKILCVGNINSSGIGLNKNVHHQCGLVDTLTINKGEGHKIVCPCITPDRVNKRQNGRRFKENGEPMFTITSQDRHGILVGDFRYDEGLRIRKNGLCPCITCKAGSKSLSANPFVIDKCLK